MISKHVTHPLLFVLRAILELDRAVYGLELAKRTGLDRASCYMMLKRLVANGCLTVEWEKTTADGRPPRKYYTLVPERRAEVVALLAERGINLPEVPF